MYIVEKGFLKDLIIVVQVALMQPQRCTGAMKSRHLSIYRTGSSVINYPNKDLYGINSYRTNSSSYTNYAPPRPGVEEKEPTLVEDSFIKRLALRSPSI
jgi:hypothetical protein|uniref:Uncharacterized protein n=2 Tax=Picea TaxID=3328 RepID=A0A117NG30_PICGL|nr:hypothetical protein ABT39_MTgene1924 [Picea glauca]QHR89911.1 hypothetical protein Q903MT_gene3933 [Picea sitchensis]